MPVSVEKLRKARDAWEALDPATRAAREAEEHAKLEAICKRLERQLAPIRANLEALPPAERKRFVSGDVRETPVHVLVQRRALIRRVAANARRPAMDRALLARTRGRRRERRERGASRRVGARGDPSEPDDEDDDLTDLQRAQRLLKEARDAARGGGRRTYLAFLEILAANAAAEIARLSDWSEAP